MVSSLVAFAALAVVVVVMPGADTVLVLRTSLRDGARGGTITAMGIVCGPIIWGALAGFGVAFVLNQNALVFSIVAAAGGVYLGYLAYGAFLSARSTWRSSTVDVTGSGRPSATSMRRPMTYFFTGLMTNLLNPKIGVFYLSVMPGLFLGQDITVWLGALLGTIHAVLGLIFLGSVAILAGFARECLRRSRVQATIELVCGLCLLWFALFLIIEAAIHSGLFA